MAHWDAVLPGRILHVQHESVVEHLEGNVRRLLDFLGLPFEAACIEFYRTERSVRTASSEQVRQPIYKEGIDQWRSFEPWLGPLDRKSTRLNSSHSQISYAVFCLKKKRTGTESNRDSPPTCVPEKDADRFESRVTNAPLQLSTKCKASPCLMSEVSSRMTALAS